MVLIIGSKPLMQMLMRCIEIKSQNICTFLVNTVALDRKIIMHGWLGNVLVNNGHGTGFYLFRFKVSLPIVVLGMHESSESVVWVVNCQFSLLFPPFSMIRIGHL